MGFTAPGSLVWAGRTLLWSNDQRRTDDLPEPRSVVSGPVLQSCGQLDLRLLFA